MRYEPTRVSRINGSFFLRHHTTALWEGRHRFRLFDEFFTHTLRGDGIVPRDEVTDVAQILDRYGRPEDPVNCGTISCISSVILGFFTSS